ncbi:hypothetical protein C0J52_26464 [Blattella germanica]|nr:hypothetical protein C0J52_26464 [Blattella germanica]
MEMGRPYRTLEGQQMDIQDHRVGPPHRQEDPRQTATQMGRSLQRTCGSLMVTTSRESGKVEMFGIPIVQRVSNEQMYIQF